jgi:hypothetical protein
VTWYSLGAGGAAENTKKIPKRRIDCQRHRPRRSSGRSDLTHIADHCGRVGGLEADAANVARQPIGIFTATAHALTVPGVYRHAGTFLLLFIDNANRAAH